MKIRKALYLVWLMKKILLATFLIAPIAMATDTLDCGNDKYHFSIHVGHENGADLVYDYQLYKNENLIIKSTKFISSIMWVENDLESKGNFLSIIDIDNKIDLIVSKDFSYLIISGIKEEAHCDWIR